MDVLDVPAAADEGERDQVGPGPQGPAQVGDVLVAERGHRDGDPGEVEALVVGDEAALDDEAADPGSVDLDDLQGDPTVVDEDPLAGGDVPRQAGVGSAAAVLVPFDAFVGGDGELVAAFEKYRALGEGSEADLRALKVGEHADTAAALVRGLADPAVPLLVLDVGAVAQVESGDVHPGVDQGLDLVVGVGGGPEGTDDFCSAHSAESRHYRRVTSMPVRTTGWPLP